MNLVIYLPIFSISIAGKKNHQDYRKRKTGFSRLPFSIITPSLVAKQKITPFISVTIMSVGGVCGGRGVKWERTQRKMLPVVFG